MHWRRREVNGGGYGLLFAGAAAALALAASAGWAQEAEDAKPLTIATWGGAYGQSQDVAYFKPFSQQTGTNVSTEIYDGTLASVMGLLGRGTPRIDVVDLSSSALASLCRDGQLETIEPAKLSPSPDGAAAADDFIVGGLPDCGVASVAWSAAVAYSPKAFAGEAPTKIADLLDTKRFPGKRALPNGPRYTLEFALLADGVEPEKIYGDLSTPAGVDRAFAALDRMKGEILWWNKAQDPLTWLARERAIMAVSYSGRIFRASVGDQLKVLWDGQIYDVDLWAIPKTADNKGLAKKFIAFATEPKRIAEQAKLIAYGPMRKSAIPLVGKHPVVGVEMAAFLPTAPQNFQKALKFDEAWWIANGDPLRKRFKEWRSKADLPEASQEQTSSTKPQQSRQ
jgi:putative spermidine/putrescine transport system substrate-binding protein